MASRLRRDDVADVTFAHDDSALTRRILATWFTSPYWLDCARLSPVLEASSAVDAGTAAPDGDRAQESDEPPRLLETPLSRSIHLAAGRRSRGPNGPYALKDQYLLGQVGALSLDDLQAFAALVATSGAADVRVRRTDGVVVEASLHAFLAWTLAQTIRSGYLPHVGSGLASRLMRVGPGDGSLRRAGILCLLPLPASVVERSRLLAAGQIVTPVAIYPLVSTALPEVSPAIAPIWDDVHVAPEPSRPHLGSVSPLSSVERASHRMRRTSGRVIRGSAANASNHVVSTLHRAKNRLRETRIIHLLMERGIDYDRSRGLAKRLLIRHDANPWLTRSARRALDEAMWTSSATG